MSLRPSKPASQRGAAAVGTAAFRAQLAECTAAAHRWNMQEHVCKANACKPAPDHTPSRTDAGYADLEEAYELGKAPKWTWSNLVKEEDIRGRSDRDRRGLRDIPKEPDALECQICLDGLDEKAGTQGTFGSEELEILQELTEEARKTNPDAPVVCGHAFHKNCLARWIREGRIECPSCRLVIPSDVMLRLVPELAAPPPAPYQPPPPYNPASPQYDPNGASDDDEFDDPVGPNNYNGDILLPPDTSQEDSIRILRRVEDFLIFFDRDDDLRPEQEIIDAIDLMMQDALDNTNSPTFTEYVLYRDWGDILINRSRSLSLYNLAAWFEQKRRAAFEENDRLDRMFDGVFN